MNELYDAICDRDLDEVRRLIEAGADVNARHEDDSTPLHVSVLFDSAEITQLLIEAGADINALDGSYQTPLYRHPLEGIKFPSKEFTPSQKLLLIKQLLTAILHNLEGSEDNTALKDMIIKVMMGKLE
jgi:ankyrin repeat protein